MFPATFKNIKEITLEVGYCLIPPFDEKNREKTVERIRKFQEEIKLHEGVDIPKIYIRDNMSLNPYHYCIKINGFEITESHWRIGYVLCFDTGFVREKLKGEVARDPIFGFEAIWVPEENARRAQKSGYFVLDFITIFLNHIVEIIRLINRKIISLSNNDSLERLYLLYMASKNETCLELDEMIYHHSCSFWNQNYNNLIDQLSGVECDNKVTRAKAIKQFQRKVHQIAEENKLTCIKSNLNGRLYFSLIPYPIYIGIDRGSGEISIAAPHIDTKHFKYNEYPEALSWINNYLNIDASPLIKQIEDTREKFYLSIKASDIVKTSIQAIVEAILSVKGFRYEIRQNRIRSEIYIEKTAKEIYRIEVYHKPFSQDSSLLVTLLNNPHEEFVDEKIHCHLLKDGFDFQELKNKGSTRVYSAK